MPALFARKPTGILEVVVARTIGVAVGEAVARVVDLALRFADRVLHLALELVDLAADLKLVVAGQTAGGVLDVALELVGSCPRANP